MPFEKTKIQESYNYEFTLQKKYLDFIKQGKKTVEGRINSGLFQQVKKGDRIKFFNNKNPKEFVICEVVFINEYPTFKEMLTGESVELMLPNCDNIESGVAIYENIPTYQERCKKHGCIAIGVKVLE